MDCGNSEILGKAGEGIHAARIGGFALWDIIGTIALAGVVSFTTNIGFLTALVLLIIIAVFLHWWFCVPTALNKKLGIYNL
ncbi:Hypothetical protein PACV_437 [Pacmanvirus A23]|uniref:Hypothetical protein n=1 Tax=Pacmanvirus A23 TaxID=1932881 RepID=UPI000A0958C6|nr:Hypothetical protein B9W72_gp433 [Pacmanvirus A23]SIP86150.1 Hypothetical protein PACV_437 [Pacmanvirus A23]